MRIVMMGSGGFAEPVFETLLCSRHPVVGLVTQPDRDKGAQRASTRQVGRGMKTIALESNIPILQPESINTPEGVADLRNLEPDLFVVAAYGQILSKDVLAAAKNGGINVHASLLPKFRGAAPVAWAIYHGETETGVTIIRMSVSLDAGDMLAQESIAIGPDETAGDVETRLAPLGARLALQVIERLAAGPVAGVKQDKALVTKAPKLTKENGVIDWTRGPIQVCNQIRAMQPWPTAYSFLYRAGHEPLRCIIGSAAPTAANFAIEKPPSPGTTHVPPSLPLQLLVAAGDRAFIEIRELQPAGKRRMTAGEFLRGHPLRADDRFGPPPA